MYTFCPECNRQYRVRAEQLSAAQGVVICGFCGKQFNALARLNDRPQKLPLKIPTVKVAKKNVITAGARLPPVQEGMVDDTPGYPAVKPTAPDTGRQINLSEALLDDEQDTRVTKRGRGWAAAALAMLVVFTLQFAWFERDVVLQAYPQLVPWAARFCGHFHCNLMREIDPSTIRILNRDVRRHPHYADTLLVNATMVNQAVMVRPFPKIQFTLFNTSGRMLAYREFTVDEYLDRSIDVMKGMMPEQPVHFVLEITGPTQDAVSFQFRFL
ncbi:MAG: zinc-ribbon and DUF3426 domain-containing protein [Gammaproteobacteria bacterium]